MKVGSEQISYKLLNAFWMSDKSVQLVLPDGSTTVLRCCGLSPLIVSRRLVQTVRTTEVVHINGHEEVTLNIDNSSARGNWRYQITPIPLPRRYSVVSGRPSRSSDMRVARSESSGLDTLIQVR